MGGRPLPIFSDKEPKVRGIITVESYCQKLKSMTYIVVFPLSFKCPYDKVIADQIRIIKKKP